MRTSYPTLPEFTISVKKKMLGTLKPHKAAGPDQMTTHTQGTSRPDRTYTPGYSPGPKQGNYQESGSRRDLNTWLVSQISRHLDVHNILWETNMGSNGSDPATRICAPRKPTCWSPIDAVVMDFSKAFDMAHNRLLYKLERWYPVLWPG